MHGDFARHMVPDELTVGTVLAGSVLALPLEEIGRQKTVAVLEVLSHAAFVKGHQQAQVLR